MKSLINGSVDSVIESTRLATAETHVGNRALVRGLASGGELLLGLLSLELSGVGSENNSCDDIGHRTTAVGTKDLDGDDIGRLRDTVSLGSNGTGTVSTVAIAVLIDIVLGDGLAPARATGEFYVVDVDTSVNDVDVNALATLRVVQVLGEGTKS